jgi:hypothetical protein
MAMAARLPSRGSVGMPEDHVKVRVDGEEAVMHVTDQSVMFQISRNPPEDFA